MTPEPICLPAFTASARAGLRRPVASARATACARVLAASFMKMFLACDYTVSGAIPSDLAMRLFDIPCAIIRRIAVSRRDRLR